MKKVISFVVLLVLLSLHIFAQSKDNKIEEKPSLDGIWILEKVEGPSYLSVKDYEDYVLAISSVSDQLKIKKNMFLEENPRISN